MNNSDVSILIKNIRSHLDLTQEHLAQKIGVTFSTVNSWENGKRKPHPFLYQKLLEIAEETGKKKNLPVRRTQTGRKS